jgi:Uma2 family endonuclease
MAIETRISEETYERLALAEPDHKWELYEGRLQERPGMTWEHGRIAALLSYLLQLQLDRSEHGVASEWRVRRSAATIFIPDLVVVPTAYGEPFRGWPGTLAIFSDPLPLVVEVRSATTGGFDVDAKLPVYQQRGDLEIWRIHPYERTLTSRRRNPDGSYEETIHREGSISPAALPGVTIDLATLFDA